MKKYIIAAAAAISLTGCQKIAQGGNLDRVKKEEGVVRYDDEEAPKGTYKPTETKVEVLDQSIVTIPGVPDKPTDQDMAPPVQPTNQTAKPTPATEAKTMDATTGTGKK